MSIDYPLSLPSTPGLSQVVLHAVASVSVARSPFTFATHTQEHQGMAWGAECYLPPLDTDQAEEWRCFMLKLNGQKGSFLLGDPMRNDPRGDAGGDPLVNGASQTGQSLVTDGWTPDITGILLTGDLIQIGQRLYKVLIDADSDSSGNATLDIWPRLRESPPDNESIVTVNCKGLFRLAQNTNPISSVDISKFTDFSFSAVEYL